ncbi:MAG: hydrolase [Lachnospiraceae bacterium]|nr:hydrolase [Lachnospiraceae bacterium]MCI9150381.1 hydrolase [Lachnospiraceae bacterium]
MRYADKNKSKKPDREALSWKRRRRRLCQISLLLALLMGLSQGAQVAAETIKNANDKKNEAQNELDSVNQNINQIQARQGELQNEINALDAELVQVILSLNILEVDLQNKEAELAQREEELAQAQADEEAQYQAMKKRIRFMYERGDTAVLTAILESKSITELLNRVEYYNEVYDYDRELLVTYQNIKLQVAELKTQVEYEIAEMEELQANFQEEQLRYEAMLEEKRGQMADFDTKLATAHDLAAQYQETIKEQNDIIRKEEKRLEEERKKKEEEEKRKREQEALAAANSNKNNNQSNDSASNNNTSSNNSANNNTSNNNTTNNTDKGSNTNTGANGDNNNQGNTGSNSNGNDSNTGSEGNNDKKPDESGGKNPPFTTGVSGSDVVSYACQYIGNPYVYGGTDINNGIDCSAFVQQVFGHFGIKLPRVSYDQINSGKEVSYENAQAGDIICYSGHVAIYMGNGQIVHASNSAPYPAGGIKTGSATYRTILSVRRVL